MTKRNILAINPGSTSTKVAVFQDDQKLFGQTITHSAEELAPFPHVMDQHEFRKRNILAFLARNGFDVRDLSAVVGRGGLLPPLESGTYCVSVGMIDYLRTAPLEHASSLGALLASEIAEEAGVKSYIVDPVVVDELDDLARVTGWPQIERISIFHALNQKAAAREAAKMLGKPYEECRLIVTHLGGGISVGAHRLGRVIDVNNALTGDGPIAPERAGSLPVWDLIELVLSGKYSRDELKKMVTGRGGIVAHLQINDMRRVEELVKAGDPKATRVYGAMAYSVAKWIGAMAAALEGTVDAVVLTGGIAYDKDFVEAVSRRVRFIARLIVLPGEDEMAALVKGALRVLNGEESAKEWKLK
jgi:butyrate kinase